MKILKFLLARINERSSVVTILSVFTGLLGFHIAPQHVEAIATGVSGVAAAALILIPDGKVVPEKPE